MNFNGFAQFGEPAGFAAGDEHLPLVDLVQHEVLPPGVQLGQHIVQQQQRRFAALPLHQLPLRQLQADGSGAGLTLGTVGFQVDAGKSHIKIVLVGACETLTGFQFRPVVTFQVIL